MKILKLLAILSFWLVSFSVQDSNAARITLEGRLYDSWAGHLGDIVMRDSLAFIAQDISGLQILDIADPNDITRISWLDGNDGESHKMAISGNVACISDYYGLSVIDLSTID